MFGVDLAGKMGHETSQNWHGIIIYWVKVHWVRVTNSWPIRHLIYTLKTWFSQDMKPIWHENVFGGSSCYNLNPSKAKHKSINLGCVWYQAWNWTEKSSVRTRLLPQNGQSKILFRFTELTYMPRSQEPHIYDVGFVSLQTPLAPAQARSLWLKSCCPRQGGVSHLLSRLVFTCTNSTQNIHVVVSLVRSNTICSNPGSHPKWLSQVIYLGSQFVGNSIP